MVDSAVALDSEGTVLDLEIPAPEVSDADVTADPTEPPTPNPDDTVTAEEPES